MSKRDITGREDIIKLVDAFYDQVFLDKTIGHFFNEVAPIKKKTHMPIMYNFWENVLFYTGAYKGNAMGKHVVMNKKSPLNQEHFDQWLALWKATVNNMFEGEKADEAINKAKQIASMMHYNVQQS